MCVCVCVCVCTCGLASPFDLDLEITCGVPKESQLERGLEVSHDGLMDSRSPETSWDKESFMIKVGRNMRSWDTKKGTNPNHGSRSKLIEGFPPLGWVGT